MAQVVKVPDWQTPVLQNTGPEALSSNPSVAKKKKKKKKR
jgi:hypothetical protein